MSRDVQAEIASLVKDNDIVLFMKGTRHMPQCGFSATAIAVLKELGATYKEFNVLADLEVREGIKQYSDWPTIPQLYVRGEFVGGSDIIREMFENGELKELLSAHASA